MAPESHFYCLTETPIRGEPRPTVPSTELWTAAPCTTPIAAPLLCRGDLAVGQVQDGLPGYQCIPGAPKTLTR